MGCGILAGCLIDDEAYSYLGVKTCLHGRCRDTNQPQV